MVKWPGSDLVVAIVSWLCSSSCRGVRCFRLTVELSAARRGSRSWWRGAGWIVIISSSGSSSGKRSVQKRWKERWHRQWDDGSTCDESRSTSVWVVFWYFNSKLTPLKTRKVKQRIDRRTRKKRRERKNIYIYEKTNNKQRKSDWSTRQRLLTKCKRSFIIINAFQVLIVRWGVHMPVIEIVQLRSTARVLRSHFHCWRSRRSHLFPFGTNEFVVVAHKRWMITWNGGYENVHLLWLVGKRRMAIAREVEEKRKWKKLASNLIRWETTIAFFGFIALEILQNRSVYSPPLPLSLSRFCIRPLFVY